jgi:RNA polymerase sigma-70 factor (ECF subfamily)
MASSVRWTFPGPAAPEWGLTLIRPEAGCGDRESADTARLAQLTGAELVERSLTGCTDAFDLIVVRYGRQIYRLCYRFAGNHEDASDLSQDVFVRAFRGRKAFRGHASVGTWLYRIGVNVCLNRVTARTTLGKLTEPIEEKQFVDVRAESPSELMLKDERAARVRAAIAQLPRKQRAALILRTYHEMSHQEIADVLGSSVGAVKANFFHALGNLKKLLAEGQ